MKLIRLLLALAIALPLLSLSACGKKVKPEYPDDTTFPNTYPRR